MKKTFYYVLVFAIVFVMAACAIPAAEQTPESEAAVTNTQTEIVPAKPTPPEEMSAWQGYYELGLELFQGNNYEEAYDAFKTALDIDPTQSDVWLAMLRVVRDDPHGYANTLNAALVNTGDSETFQPLIDECEEEAALRADGVVEWVDPTVEKLVRDYLDKPDGDILRSELDGIESVGIYADMPMIVNYSLEIDWNRSLDGEVYYLMTDDTAYNKRSTIQSLEDFKNFRNLSGFEMTYSELSDLSSAKYLKDVWNFSIYYSFVSDISPLEGFYHIDDLSIQYCEVENLDGLSNLNTIHRLSLAGNNISDVSPLSGLFRLEALELRENSITDFSALSGLKSLEELSLSDNPLSDLDPLREMTQLKNLSLYVCGISDVSALSGLVNLDVLDLSDNSVSDLNALSGLSALRELNLNGNQIVNLEPLMGVSGLTRLYLTGNEGLADFTPLLALKQLQVLEAMGTRGSFVRLQYIPELCY